MAALLAGKNITTSFGAKFSIPFALATILVHGRSAVECFDLDAVRNPRVQALVAKIDVREEPAYTRAYPASRFATSSSIFATERSIRGRCEVMKGEPTNPHRSQDVEKKYFDLMSPVWGADRAKALYDTVLALEDVADMREFADRYALSAAMQVHGQPQSAFRYTPNGVRDASTQEQIVAGPELERRAGDLEDGVALNKNDPFIL